MADVGEVTAEAQQSLRQLVRLLRMAVYHLNRKQPVERRAGASDRLRVRDEFRPDMRGVLPGGVIGQPRMVEEPAQPDLNHLIDDETVRRFDDAAPDLRDQVERLDGLSEGEVAARLEDWRGAAWAPDASDALVTIPGDTAGEMFTDQGDRDALSRAADRVGWAAVHGNTYYAPVMGSTAVEGEVAFAAERVRRTTSGQPSLATEAAARSADAGPRVPGQPGLRPSPGVQAEPLIVNGVIGGRPSNPGPAVVGGVIGGQVSGGDQVRAWHTYPGSERTSAPSDGDRSADPGETGARGGKTPGVQSRERRERGGPGGRGSR
jgi:hypothetical protein